jgi:plasmid stabilization system protein ParE
MSRKAEMDLAEVADFIALDNPRHAERFEEELLDHAQKIARAPLACMELAILGSCSIRER